jgi:peptidyl-prolyl cis-trans isomerase B (cyclophilin B)
MSGSKRQRELARAKYERQQARRAAGSQRRQRNQRIIAVVVVVGLVLGSLAWVLIGRQSSEDVAAIEPVPSPSAAAPEASEAATSDPAASDPAAAEPALLDCAAPGTPRPNDISFDAPAGAVTSGTLTLGTNCGNIVITLDPAAAETVASEAFLAQEGFYDGTQCHRLTTEGIFVLQCGDPAGDGTGGPGYTVPDENLPADGENNYPAGTVAMANAGPGTSGSQFFIVYDDTTLPGAYTIWGQVTEGLDIVQEIASVGVEGGGADGPPRQPVFIETATIQPN